jgi:hypothetical protein
MVHPHFAATSEAGVGNRSRRAFYVICWAGMPAILILRFLAFSGWFRHAAAAVG